jgi:hypothetical protein
MPDQVFAQLQGDLLAVRHSSFATLRQFREGVVYGTVGAYMQVGVITPSQYLTALDLVRNASHYSELEFGK